MGLDKIRAKTRAIQKQQAKEKEVEFRGKSNAEVWSESSHAVTVAAVRDHYSNVKPFNPDLYSKQDAAELFKYSKFSIGNRGISTPADVSGKKPGEKSQFEKVNFQDRQDTMEHGTSGRTSVAEDMHYKHVWTRDKDDFDRDFRLLGAGGDFSEVRYKLPEDKVMDFEVRGPAAGRAKQKAAQERLKLEELMKQGETEKEAKDREKREARERKEAAQNALKREDWRTNQDPGTREDVDFLDQIQEWKPTARYEKRKQKELEKKSNIYPNFIGPKSNTVDYEHVDRMTHKKMLAENLNVRQQVSEPRSNINFSP